MPEGTDDCPSCGAGRLELAAAPAIAPAVTAARPRRRHRGWVVVALLLCAVVGVALAGQAYQSGGDPGADPPDRTDKPVRREAKGDREMEPEREAEGQEGETGTEPPEEPKPRPAQLHGSFLLASGHVDRLAFRIESPAAVSYAMEVHGDGFADACLLAPGEWEAFAAGEGNGTACRFAAQEASDAAALEPGDWLLGFRCVDTGVDCDVDYTLSAHAA